MEKEYTDKEIEENWISDKTVELGGKSGAILGIRFIKLCYRPDHKCRWRLGDVIHKNLRR